MLLPYNILKKYLNTFFLFSTKIKLRVKEIIDFPLNGTVISHFKSGKSVITIGTEIDGITYIIYAVNSENEYHWLNHDLSLFTGLDNHEQVLEKIKKFLIHKIRKEKISMFL
jgi:hypothetical protein